LPRRVRPTDHPFVGRGLICTQLGCGLSYHDHTTWDEARGGVEHPRALLASQGDIRHLPGRNGFPACGVRRGTFTLMRPSDGVYSMQVCKKCKLL
jgi:hypothetical protein